MSDLTDRQKLITRMYEEFGSQYEVAKKLEISRSTVQSALRRARKAGWIPAFKTSDRGKNGDKLNASSILYNAEGKVVLEWQKTSPDAQLFEQFVEELCDRVVPRESVPEQVWESDDDILAEVCVYDLHFGMYACDEETGGGDYDTQIARTRLIAAVQGFVRRFNYPKVIRLVLGGDQTHSDDNKHQTPSSGHILDQDTRHSLVIGKLIGVCRDAIDLLSQVCEQIEIVVVAGNHDPIGSLWLREVLTAYYANVDRVTVCQQKTPRIYHVWGKCLSVYAHGDKIKCDKWPMIIAAEQAKLWGQTKYRYARLGHIHTRKVIAPIVVDEKGGLEITYLSSLANPDAWHAGAGYVGNQRAVQAFELSKEHGVVSQFYSNV